MRDLDLIRIFIPPGVSLEDLAGTDPADLESGLDDQEVEEKTGLTSAEATARMIEYAAAAVKELPTEIALEVASEEDGKIVFDVTRLTVVVEHAFGKHARYKGRRTEEVITLRPVGMQVIATMSPGTSLADIVAALATEQVRACEIVVRDADEREKGVPATAIQTFG